jgi:hypothetical protein
MSMTAVLLLSMLILVLFAAVLVDWSKPLLGCKLEKLSRGSETWHRKIDFVDLDIR